MRQQIDKLLVARGWVIDAASPNQDVFVERAVVPRLSSAQQSKLGSKAPDYSLFCDGVAVAGQPLRLNEIEVTEPLSPVLLRRFNQAGTPDVVTVPQTVISSREQLIDIFERLNDVMRQAGVRAGLDRFTEFANLLFLKLASEQDADDTTWQDLNSRPVDDLPSYLNGFVLDKLRKQYSNDVLSPTRVSGRALKQIVNELNALHLTSVDEDVKGVAFEHFLGHATGGNDLGEYFTPRHVVRLAVKILNPQFGQTVYDPFCGTGGFLIEAFRHLSLQARPTADTTQTLQHKSVFGTEITSTARIAKMNMILFGDGHSGVEQGDSLLPERQAGDLYDNVLSNIPFSLNLPSHSLRAVDAAANDADEACLLHCFNKLKQGGQLAVVVPEGLVVNRSHRHLWHHLCNESRIRAIMMLPRGTFAPYTTAGTRIVYLTDKGQGQTDWYYQANLDKAKSGPSIEFDEFAFFYQARNEPPDDVPDGVEVVRIEHRDDPKRFAVRRPWRNTSAETVPLRTVAAIRNGTTITKAAVVPGDVPVIAGGRGTIPYYHNAANVTEPSVTISKSGAYAGYVWWHEAPIWASDCLIIQTADENSFLSFYLYLCLRACQDELYERQQGTGQPHFYQEQLADFPVPKLSLQDQHAMIADAHSALRDLEAAQARATDTLRAAVQSVTDLYRPKSLWK